MPKYQKLPVVIEAEQWFPGVEIEGVVSYQPPDAVIGSRVPDQPPQRFAQQPYPAVVTLEGPMRVSSGDWIITGVKGERYPCKPEIFEATYKLFTPRKCVKCGADVMPDDEWKKCLNCGKYLPTTEPSDPLDDQA